MNKQFAKPIKIPIIADSVASPELYYKKGFDAIYFYTSDEKYGRITFEGLDSIKISRGEYMPYKHNYDLSADIWVYEIENSKWQQERYNYEKKHYANAYEFGGNVDEMLTDYKHYLFEFHDEFIEAITKGFWFEQDEKRLSKKKLLDNHPFLPLSEENALKLEADTIIARVRINPSPKNELIVNAKFCSQKLFEFVVELDGKISVVQEVVTLYRSANLVSVLRGFFGKETAIFNGVATLEQVKPYFERETNEIEANRQARNKR
jgi:hypothetical protein